MRRKTNALTHIMSPVVSALSIFLSLVVFLTPPNTSAHTATQAPNRKWLYSLELAVTRCFLSQSVSIKCRDYSDEKQKPSRREELEIEARDYFGVLRTYGYGKALEGPICQEHLAAIKRLLSGTNQVCITGESETNLETGESFSRWRAIETQKGEYRW